MVRSSGELLITVVVAVTVVVSEFYSICISYDVLIKDIQKLKTIKVTNKFRIAKGHYERLVGSRLLKGGTVFTSVMVITFKK